MFFIFFKFYRFCFKLFEYFSITTCCHFLITTLNFSFMKFIDSSLLIKCLVGIFVFPVKFLSSAPQSMRFIQGKVLGAAKEGILGLSSLELTQDNLAISREKF